MKLDLGDSVELWGFRGVPLRGCLDRGVMRSLCEDLRVDLWSRLWRDLRNAAMLDSVEFARSIKLNQSN